MNKTSKIFLVLILVVVAFTCGYKVGDSRGYADGYNEGYRYDCKAEIADLYKRVKDQSKALEYTDSSMKRILHENDSLKHKEAFQRMAEERAEKERIDSINREKYSKYAALYNDSINKAVGFNVKNFVLEDGRLNLLLCGVDPYRTLKECECWNGRKKDTFEDYSSAMSSCQNFVRERFDAAKKSGSKKRKGRK